ncbi:MAG: response regulator [Deltaproteobacteria bacterium]|nr:response regulator [Deltaproteobacteria bacterium]
MPQHRILFVDDDPNVLDSFSRSFRKSGFEVLTATEGAAAIKIMQADPVCVIVADYAMPNMTGTELLRICRERWPDTVRIMLTGGSDLNVALCATYSGWVYQYLEKPINSDQLAAIIREAIELRKIAVGPECARLLISSDAQSAIVQHLRITASPDRPTFADTSSPLEWALELCDSNALPPELDRLRPVILTLKAIVDKATSPDAAADIRETLAQIQLLSRRIT